MTQFLLRKRKEEYDSAVGIFVATNRELKDAERELDLVDICPFFVVTKEKILKLYFRGLY